MWVEAMVALRSWLLERGWRWTEQLRSETGSEVESGELAPQEVDSLSFQGAWLTKVRQVIAT